jgi:hypothetical protein
MTRALFTIAAVAVLTPRLVLAQAGDEQARARALFDLGREHANAGRFAEAAHAYEQSYELFSHPGTLVNFADALEDAGMRAAALERWNELIERFGAVISDQARTTAHERIAELERGLARVTVTTTPPGAAVLCDGREVGTAPLGEPLILEPGAHVIGAQLEGHRDVQQEVVLQSGGNSPVAFVLEPLAGDVEPTPPSTPDVAVSGAPPEVIEAPDASDAQVITDLEPQETNTGGSVDQDDRGRERRGFWRGPWPWIVLGVLVAAGLGVGLGVGLTEDETPADITWEIR